MNLKEQTIIQDINEFVNFDVRAFMYGKTLKVNKIMEEKPLKLAVGITKDETNYQKKGISNVGQEFILTLSDTQEQDELGVLLQSGIGTVRFDEHSANMTILFGTVHVHTNKIIFEGATGDEEVYEIEGVF